MTRTTKTKKHRQKQPTDPAVRRGSRPDYSTHTRKTPTKQTRLDRTYAKYVNQR